MMVQCVFFMKNTKISGPVISKSNNNEAEVYYKQAHEILTYMKTCIKELLVFIPRHYHKQQPSDDVLASSLEENPRLTQFPCACDYFQSPLPFA